jgi:hypothetical protein
MVLSKGLLMIIFEELDLIWMVGMWKRDNESRRDM